MNGWYAARLVRAGRAVYAPIAFWPHLAEHWELAPGWEQWAEIDLEFLARSTEVRVLMLPGWVGSVGLRAEVETAVGSGIPVRWLRVTAIDVRGPVEYRDEGVGQWAEVVGRWGEPEVVVECVECGERFTGESEIRERGGGVRSVTPADLERWLAGGKMVGCGHCGRGRLEMLSTWPEDGCQPVQERGDE